MKTKCPKQHGNLLKKEHHQYAPCPEIKHYPKNVWQSPKNPLAHPKMHKPYVTKVQSQRISMLGKILDGLQTLHFDTFTQSPIRVNWVERWSKAWVISIIGPMMWVLSVRDRKTSLGAHEIVYRKVQ
jgi:hypothetical protein